MASTGTVKWFNRDKQFGFVASDQDGDVFVHARQLEPGGCISSLVEGQRVEFEIEDSPRGKRAARVRLLESSGRKPCR
jgi:CspA family cold shock protein